MSNWTILSRYGQRFSLKQAMDNEIDSLTAKKRFELKKNGFDVDTYDKKYDKLYEEYFEKMDAAKDIWERGEISLKYDKKRNELAKQYLGIDLNLVTEG